MNAELIRRLIAAAKPFTSGDVVDETTATIPLMEELEAAIEAVEVEMENQQWHSTTHKSRS